MAQGRSVVALSYNLGVLGVADASEHLKTSLLFFSWCDVLEEVPALSGLVGPSEFDHGDQTVVLVLF